MVSTPDSAPQNDSAASYDRWLTWKHGAQMRERQRALRPGSEPRRDISPLDRDWGDQATLEATVELISPVAADVVSLFYIHLFTRLPSLRRLFPADLSTQKDRLLTALLALVAGGAAPVALSRGLEQLGRDHRKFGVRPAQYQVVGESLIDALSHFAGDRWTPAAERAWRARYGAAAAIMIQAAQDSWQLPPYWYATVTAHRVCGPDVAILQLQTRGDYPYIAGQYATLESPRLPRVWRPYSMATAPTPGAPLEFHVRATGRGGLSDALVAAVPGDTVRLGPPRGVTTLASTTGRPKLFVAGGTGWSTIKALLDQYTRDSQTLRRARLIVSCRPGEPYDPNFGALVRQLRELRTTLVHYTDELAAELAPDRIDNRDVDAYVSGPPGLIDSATTLLGTLGVPATQIYHDELLHT